MLAVLAAVLAVLAAVYVQPQGAGTTGKHARRPRPPPPLSAAGQTRYDAKHRDGGEALHALSAGAAAVERVDWAAELKAAAAAGRNESLGAYLLRRAVPLVVVNTGIDAWPAARWTPRTLLGKMERAGLSTLTMMQSRSRFNTYFDDRLAPPYANAGVKMAPRFKETSLRTSAVYERLRLANDGAPAARYLYMNGGLKEAELRADVPLASSPELREAFSVFDEGEWLKAKEARPCREQKDDWESGVKAGALCKREEPELRMWLGSAGNVATSHYDDTHNTHTVLYGAKRFQVLPPQSVKMLSLFPTGHPSDRQSQVRNLSNVGDAFPKARGVKRQEAVLRPGQTLYVPPFWVHNVESLSTSIALSIWTESAEGRMAKQSCCGPNAVSGCANKGFWTPLWETLQEVSGGKPKSPTEKSQLVTAAMLVYAQRILLSVHHNLMPNAAKFDGGVVPGSAGECLQSAGSRFSSCAIPAVNPDRMTQTSVV